MNQIPSPQHWTTSFPPAPRLEGPTTRSHPDGDHALITLREVAALVRRHGGALALWILFCLATAAWFIHVTPAEYTASTSLILEAPRSVGTTGDAGGSAAARTLDSAQAESQIQVVRSERILSSVFDLLDLQGAPESAEQPPGLRDRLQGFVLHALGRTRAEPEAETLVPSTARTRAFQAFSDRVGVRRIGQSYVLEISYRALSPAQASRIANAVTAAYIRAQVVFKAAAAARGTEFLQGRISDLRAEGDAALDGIKRGIIPDAQFPDADARVIGAALTPLGKSYPQTGLVLAFALVVGFLTGGAALAVRQSLDRTIRSRQHLGRFSGLPCLGVLPYAGRPRGFWKGRGSRWLGGAVIDDPQSAFSHAMRTARTAVLVAWPGEQRTRTIGIVSWSRGEGRTTVASNLAQLLAVTGERTVLVDGDLANPRLTDNLCPGQATGLADALRHDGEASEAPTVPLSDTLWCVPALGTGEVGNPNTYLGSPRMQALLAQFQQMGDVIVDLPPLKGSADAQAISRFLDGIVLVVAIGRTTLDDVADAIRVLEGANARVVGIVLNQPRATRPT